MKRTLKFIKDYIFKILVWLDQGLNTITFGSPDETLSSRWGKGSKEGCRFCMCMCKILNIFEKGHCEKSIEHDETADSWGGSK
jgi:hypothetical protein